MKKADVGISHQTENHFLKMFVYIPGTYIGMYQLETRFARIIVCCCSGRDSCMLTSRYMLPWLRSAPYPLYVPVSPWARSATCKPCPMELVPHSTVHCSRPPARNLHLSSSESTTCKPCPMVFVPDSTVHCSRPPARNLHLSCGTSDGLALGRGRSTVWCGCSS